MEYIDWLQWPAMIVTLGASWFIASQTKRKRQVGFWGLLLSNSLWAIWGWHDEAFALVALQIALAGLNIRGASKNDPP
ncbi:hypothetical protein [Candidatus Nitrotoga arctica]|uniref:hypothetical protein n=1 Tax=Candidatus Nitrotoga arctica TaxID=453162 RepID=UPI001EFB86DA|nr:hypothetical protein [Candidatus Nitrotoga arctica]